MFIHWAQRYRLIDKYLLAGTIVYILSKECFVTEVVKEVLFFGGNWARGSPH